jgi:hypothetical protein
MDKLLTAVLDAHGGAENWANVSKITARMSLGGPFWAGRGWPDLYTKQTVTLSPHHEHITFSPFTSANHVSVLDVGPERVTIATRNGTVVEERAKPRDSFPLPYSEGNTRWDAIQVAYFTSAAVWNYLTAPFVFAQPGVEAVEVAPWREGETTWRRLAVKFPRTNANHNDRQTFFFDEDLMQRRMDYSPDVTGNPPVAHYSHDPKTFDGFVFSTRRLIHLHDTHGVADQSFAPITIDIDSVSVERV